MILIINKIAIKYYLHVTREIYLTKILFESYKILCKNWKVLINNDFYLIYFC